MNKIRTIHISNTGLPVDVVDRLGPITFDDTIRDGQLVMLQHGGLYFLVPREILQECALLLERRKKDEEAFNILPPITIIVQQCIPIPSETAKILLEL